MKKHENILVFYRKAPAYTPQMEQGKPYTWNSRRSGGAAGGIKQSTKTPIRNEGTRYPGSICASNRRGSYIRPRSQLRS